MSRGFSSQVRQRSGGRCEVQIECDNAEAVHQHHRRAKGAGGDKRPDTNLPANLLDVCHLCHGAIHADPADSYDNGWLIYRNRKGISPCEVPVVLAVGRCLLDNEGNSYRIPGSGVAS